jgi:hypothetical protein
MQSLTPEDWALIFIITTLLAAAAVCIITWKLAYADGYHAGKAAEHARQAHRRIRENRAARARETLPLPPGPVPAPWPYMVIEKRTLALPVPPHPARWGSLLTDTGEFRAIAKAGTDLYIDQLQAEGEAHRARIRQELTA